MALVFPWAGEKQKDLVGGGVQPLPSAVAWYSHGCPGWYRNREQGQALVAVGSGALHML